MIEIKKEMMPVRRFIKTCRLKSRRNRTVVADANMELTGRQLLLRTLIFRRLLRRYVLEKDEKNVGILLPPSVGGVLANAAITLDGRTVVNLNYTVSEDVMNHCIRKAGIKHLITSNLVMSRLKYNPHDCEVVFLEELKNRLTTADKLAAAFQAYCMPTGILNWWLGVYNIQLEDTMALVFTSGSTGIPKGVMLMHKNLASNIEGYWEHLHLRAGDSLLGILPFFHSFGYLTIWTVLSREMTCVYHYTPLEPAKIGELCKKYQCEILPATPTFLRTYLRKCDPEMFKSLEVVLTGADRLPVELMDAFEKKFGIRPFEGYGITEMAPVISANMPDTRKVVEWELCRKDGSVGLPLHTVAVKVLNVDTGEECGVNEVGMLWAAGPSVMKGYYEDPEKTAEVLKDGWYCTGDLVRIDEDGFIFITGRLTRFSKIGGEMVPHEGIEDALNKVLGNSPEDPLKIAVTAVSDEKKGEKLVVLYTEMNMTPQDACKALVASGFPSIWIPAPDAFFQVPEIMILGTGKPDLHALKETAAQMVGKEI